MDRVVIRSNGRPMTCKGRILNPSANRNGYLQVEIYGKHYYVHRLVLLVFCGKKKPRQETRHLNDVKSNCKLYNLKYGSYKDNHNDRIKNNRNGLW